MKHQRGNHLSAHSALHYVLSYTVLHARSFRIPFAFFPGTPARSHSRSAGFRLSVASSPLHNQSPPYVLSSTSWHSGESELRFASNFQSNPSALYYVNVYVIYQGVKCRRSGAQLNRLMKILTIILTKNLSQVPTNRDMSDAYSAARVNFQRDAVAAADKAFVNPSISCCPLSEKLPFRTYNTGPSLHLLPPVPVGTLEIQPDMLWANFHLSWPQFRQTDP